MKISEITHNAAEYYFNYFININNIIYYLFHRDKINLKDFLDVRDILFLLIIYYLFFQFCDLYFLFFVNKFVTGITKVVIIKTIETNVCRLRFT